MYKLLIVDDNNLQIQSLLNYINWKKYSVTQIKTARDGKKGLELFQSYQPDIIITDIVMPVMDGIQMTKEIRKISDKPKFIFISCYEDFSYLKAAMDNEVYSYVLKPIDQEVLEEKVSKIIGKIEYEKEYDNMNRLLDENTEIFRKNFLHRLIYTKYVNNDYFNSVLPLLNLDKFKNFMITKIGVVNGKNQFVDIYSLINLMENSMFLTDSGTVVVENNNILVVLFMTDSEDKEEFLNHIQNLLSDYLTLVKQEYDIDLNIGLSSVHNSLLHTHIILSQATYALENSLSLGEGSIEVYDESASIQPDYNLLALKESLNDLIDRSSVRQLDTFINTYCPENVSYSKYAIRTLNASVFTLVQLLLTERNLNLQAIVGDLGVMWDDLYILETPVKQRNWLIGFLKFIVEFMDANETKVYHKLIVGINEYIDKSYAEITNVEQITEKFYISYSYARKIYKEITGKTIFDALLSKRMEEAKKMLSGTDMHIYEVGDAVGYTSKTHFINAFKNYTGYSPKEYRENRLGKDEPKNVANE